MDSSAIPGELFGEGVDLSALIRDNGLRIFKKDDCVFDIINAILEHNVSEDPFYIVDIGKVIRQYRRWAELLPDVEVFYAVKCNPNSLVMRVLAGLGCGADCASKNEIAAAIAAGVDPSKIIYANPCKASGQIKYARGNDVDLLTFDSDHELYKIKLYHPNANLVLRILVNDAGSVCRFGSKFGAAPDEVKSLFAIAAALKLNVVGVSFHIGSGCRHVERYAEAIASARTAFDIGVDHGFTLTLLDIGGGFPPEEEGDVAAKPEGAAEPITFEAIAGVVKSSLHDHFEDVPNLRVIAEPGRYMVASSHTLVVNVINKKEKRNVDGEREISYYLNDSVYGSFNCLFFDHAAPMICPFNERNGTKFKSKLFGNTCDSIDMISECVLLPELALGEWLFVEKFGAYTVAASSTFNGFANTGSIYIMTC